MAEVSQRLSCGAQGLSVLLQSPFLPVLTTKGAGRFSKGCTAPGGATESAEGQCEYNQVSKCITTADRYSKSRKRNGIRDETKEQHRWRLIQLDPAVYPFVNQIKKSHVLKTALYVTPGVQPGPPVGLVVCRMTCWSNKGHVLAAAVRYDTSPLHVKEFSTLTFTLAHRRDTTPNLHIQERSIARRYGSNNTKEAGPLYRSRTAYYDLLKVSPHATQAQIKTAYYKQSFIFHPDKNQGNPEATLRFSEISEAYSVLGNISLRRKYDSGLLGPRDLHGTGKPSSKEAPGRAQGPQQWQPRPSASQQQFSRVGGRPMFDFDAFYQAHYGEQLEREKRARARKAWLEERRKQNFERWKKAKVMEVTMGVLLAVGGLILISVR